MPDGTSTSKLKLNPKLIAVTILVFGFVLSLAFVSSASPMHSAIPQSVNVNATSR